MKVIEDEGSKLGQQNHPKTVVWQVDIDHGGHRGISGCFAVVWWSDGWCPTARCHLWKPMVFRKVAYCPSDQVPKSWRCRSLWADTMTSYAKWNVTWVFQFGPSVLGVSLQMRVFSCLGDCGHYEFESITSILSISRQFCFYLQVPRDDKLPWILSLSFSSPREAKLERMSRLAWAFRWRKALELVGLLLSPTIGGLGDQLMVGEFVN